MNPLKLSAQTRQITALYCFAALLVQSASASDLVVEVTGHRVSSGKVRVASYHDANSDDARGDKGPPEFRDVQIEVREPSTKTSIKLR